jgi:ribosomal protein S18 acetylase RimI-like enzyme
VLYESTHERELAVMNLDPGQRQAFIQMQLAAQRLHYERGFPGAQHHVVLVDSAPAGTLWLWATAMEIYVLDIAVLPTHRGAGLGTRLMSDLMADAASSGKAVRLTVARNNRRAITFYERLGFSVESEDELNLSMGWRRSDHQPARRH